MKRLIIALGALALSLGVVPVAHASSVTATQCVETDTYTFSPPLTTESTTGTATLAVSAVCAAESVTTTPVNETVGQTGNTGGGTFSYTGSCALALLTGPTVHIIIGGVLVVAADVNQPFVKAIPLVPKTLCTDAAGEGQATGIGPSVHLTVTP